MLQHLYENNLEKLNILEAVALAKLNLPVETLEMLHKTFSNTLVNRELASNPKSSTDILEAVYVTEMGKRSVVVKTVILENLAKNPYCPVNILEDIYSTTGEETILWALARNPNCPERLLAQLAKHKYRDVQTEALENPNWDLETLRKHVVKKPNFRKYEMLEHPQQKLEYLEEVVYQGDKAQWFHVAQNPNCSGELLHYMSVNSTSSTRYAIARHPNLEERTIDRILLVDRLGVMVPLAQNLNCNARQLQNIFETCKDYDVLCAVASNPNCSTETLEDILSAQKDTLPGWMVSVACFVSLFERQPVKVHWVQQAVRFVTDPEMKHKADSPEEEFKIPVAYALSNVLHNLHQFSAGEASFIIDYVEEKTGFKIPYKPLNMKPGRNTLNKVPNVNLGF